ncbi:hypothetical protein BD289DRAFT_509383 [Coniella lustricola]|uniref:Uncharacterized protein n=1 Tax=Coniella lustricola TaxID=2025994 RepID=A0A2T2ZV72_9PEZI|nr:hypothetical protein BD289DRAFT_509383 [Coniella lustricola]
MVWLPLKSAEDFYDFIFALAGSGHHFIGWYNEYAVSPVHPYYLALFCYIAPVAGGEISVYSYITLYDRLEKEVPGLVEGCAKKGLVY